MQPRKRRSTPPWERAREAAAPQHSTGRAVRRWPAEAGAPSEARIPPRYRRAYDGGERRTEGPQLRRKSPTAFQRLRQSPVRHGLVGLAVAGAAVPVAVARHNTALRNPPSHENIIGSLVPTPKLTDQTVAQAWQGEEAKVADAQSTGREATIEKNLQRYASYDVPRDLAEQIYDLAVQSNINPDVAFGLVRAESTFKSSATSHVGAIGLTQLMPATASWLRPGTTRDDLRDPQVNLSVGFKYLRELIDKYDGDTHLALTAYNRGPGIVDRVLKKGGDPDNGYAHLVLKDVPADEAAR
jgi:hypothetical protein